VRFVVSNDSGERPWSVDAREIKLELRGARARTEPVQGGTQEPLILSVPPRRQQIIDLYYPLPADMDEAEDVPAFDVVWTVHTDIRVVTERTPFERIYVNRRPSESSLSIGYGTSFWYGPWYPYPVVTPVVIEHIHTYPAPRARIPARPSR
jgi:hypothetical protein